MNQEDKKKLQNDILLATEISRQFHLKNPNEAKKVVAFLHARKPFLSPRGDAFQKRMEDLAENRDIICTCMLCMQKEAEDGIFCRDCMAVIDRSVNRDAAAEEKSEETVPASSEAEEEVVEDSSETIQEEAPAASEEIDHDLWGEPAEEHKSLPIWARILIIFFAVVILAAAVLLILGHHLPISGLPWEEVTIETPEDGTKIVERQFSEKEYTITEKDPLNAPEGMFDVRVGECAGESWDTGLIEVYAYSVVAKDDPEQSAVIWVAEDGRTVGYGTLVDEENPGNIYRLR